MALHDGLWHPAGALPCCISSCIWPYQLVLLIDLPAVHQVVIPHLPLPLQNCANFGNNCSTSESEPGLWEVPMWEIQSSTGADLYSMDPGSVGVGDGVTGVGSPITGAVNLTDLLLTNFNNRSGETCLTAVSAGCYRNRSRAAASPFSATTATARLLAFSSTHPGSPMRPSMPRMPSCHMRCRSPTSGWSPSLM